METKISYTKLNEALKSTDYNKVSLAEHDLITLGKFYINLGQGSADKIGGLPDIQHLAKTSACLKVVPEDHRPFWGTETYLVTMKGLRTLELKYIKGNVDSSG